ncbi:MAG: hypothetical protein HYZ28_14390 [Myxococcales bacterium]|nr:hypothetical protein [Myxococcales bacterium]
MPRPLVLALCLAAIGCAHKAALRAELEPLRFEAPPTPPAILTENHFSRDVPAALSEAELKTILAAPVFLEEQARVGVVPVASRYEPDPDLPTVAAPAALADALEQSGMFELSSEVSTDWPTDRGIRGLRELAARYRTEYLVFYRHRFVDQSYLNPWAWGYLTGVGAIFLPGQTMEAAGVLEATLFDVKTGTILFTVFERVRKESQETPWDADRKRMALKRKLLEDAASRLADQVVAKCRRLAAARPPPPAKEAISQL